jgi:lysophospholipase L1-like esterase
VAPGRRARQAFGTLALVVGGTATGLGLAEVIVRLSVHAAPPPAKRGIPPGLPELRSAEELVRPGVRGVYNGAPYRTNGAGFRGPDYAVPKPPGVVRIAIGGDSVTMGSGVADEEAYPALVERALDGRPGEPRYEVLNLGLIGIDVRQVVARLDIGARFQPDFIVYGCTLNDIKGPHYRVSMTPWPQLMQQVDYARFATSPSYLLRVGWPLWVSARERFQARPGSYLFELRDNYFHNPPAWDDFTRGLDQLADLARRVGVPAAVFIHTNLEFLNVFHPYGEMYAQIAEAAEARGLHAIQSFPTLRGHDAESLWVRPDDAHPNAAAHVLLAQALLAGLERLPAEVWPPARHP